MRARGHAVQLMSFHPIPEWVKAKSNYSNEWYCLNKKDGFLDIGLFHRLRKLLKHHHTKVIHAHCEASAFYGGIAAKLLRLRTLCTIHRSEPAYYLPSMKNKVFYCCVDHFIAISHERRQRMIQQLGIAPENISIIHWGIDTKKIAAEPHTQKDIQALREQYEISGPLLFSLGHLGSIKGHDDSIAAMVSIKKQFPEAKLFIAGDGSNEDYERLHSLIDALQLSKSVTLLGQIGKPELWLWACDVFLLPSREEGFGLVFIEAGYCSKATVTTRVGGIPDIVIDGETGLLCAPSHPDQLADNILKLLKHPGLAKKMGQNARKRVQTGFDLNQQLHKLESLVHE